MIRRIARAIITLSCGALGLSLGYTLTEHGWLTMPNNELDIALILFPTIISGLMGYILAPGLITRVILMTTWVEGKLQKMPFSDLMGGVIGVIIGLIIGSLSGTSFSRVPFIGPYVPIGLTLLFGYLGMSIGIKKKEELLSIFSFFPKFGKDKDKVIRNDDGKLARCKVLDTSVIIDGRIADLCNTGFVEGTLVIPSFVLEELRHIADSSDLLKRNRGRRGLDILNKIRKELDIKVQILEKDYDDLSEVDTKLVRLAQELDGFVVTNDFNLNKVAELQGVRVLNINELANAIKPVVLPGEEMEVQIIKDGKESGQGIGYLDDGTMIVVDGGRKHIGQNLTVLVTSVLQTAAGRMIFAKQKSEFKKNNEVNLVG